MEFKAEGATACVVIIVLLVGTVSVYQFASMYTDLPGIDEMLGFTIGPTDPDWEQPDYVPEDSHRVTVELEALTQDALGATAGSMYIWYDADGDGTVDVGPDGIGGEGSEVETIAITSSVGTSKRTYWTGSTIGIQSHLTSMYVSYVTRVVPDMGEFDTSVPLDTIYVVDIYTSATATAADQNFAALDTSTNYNYTLTGTTLTLNIQLSITAGGEGFGCDAYTDWDTGDAYVGPFCAIVFDVADENLFLLSSSTYDETFERSSFVYYIIYLTPFFNDADDDGDGSVNLKVVMEISGAGDFDIRFFDTIKRDNFNARNFGTVDAEVSDIDCEA